MSPLRELDRATSVPSPLPLDYELHLPDGDAGALVVVVHGARTRSSSCFEVLQPLADARRRSLLAPAFTRPSYVGFQKLAAAGTPLGAASALHAMVHQAAVRLGRDAGPIDLIGFSGGAQFALRYALLFPERVRRLVLCAPGWYTMLDPNRPFPDGLAGSVWSGGRAVAIDDFLAIPTLLAVGERDVHRGPTLRVSRELDAIQGEHRLSRAIRWHDDLHRVAHARGVLSVSRLELLPATGHSFRDAVATGGLGELALAWFADPCRSARSPNETEMLG